MTDAAGALMSSQAMNGMHPVPIGQQTFLKMSSCLSNASPFESSGVSEFIDLDIFLEILKLPRDFTETFRG